MHLYTLGFWYIIRTFETIDGHCGYEFSWSPYRLLPFSGSSEYHHYHHSHNIGNYSSFFYYWDTLCGTNKEFFKFKAIKNNVFLIIYIILGVKITNYEKEVLIRINELKAIRSTTF